MTQTDAHNAYQRAYFDRPAAGNARLAPTDSPYARRHLERVIAAGALAPGLATLEIGAGLGRFTSLLVACGFDVTASDLSPTLLDGLRERHPGLATIACDAADVASHTAARFDRVVGFFMLHHLPDLDALFAGLRKVVRPGARIAFCEPNAWCVLYYAQIAFSREMTWQGDGGVRHMRPSVVLRAMERAGFAGTKCERYGFTPPAIYNRPAGERLDRALEAVPILEPVRAFQVFTARV
jgi:2-polyprenyl-3-methyl-5-hydroxy-6-metoxy-1,4-benzoquinol methylase